MNYWTPAEDAKLIALYPDHSAGQIAAALGRSRISVKNRVNRLRLRQSERPSHRPER